MDYQGMIEQALQALQWQREPIGLYEPIGYTLSAGGKRVRPQLTLIAADMFGGNPQEALPAAIALEIFHNFTLLHDDVMDNADTRRGRATVHKRWNTNTAILSGDAMLIEAYKQLEQLPADKQGTVLRLFNRMAIEICEGQQYDVDFEGQAEVSIADYLKMIRLKTSVLLATALQVGAYLAGASEQDQQLLYDFGINLGIAFQIQDDLLDTYGDEATFGKPIGGDILEGKKTYLYLTAISHSAQSKDEIAEARKPLQTTSNRFKQSQTDCINAVRAIYNRLDVEATTKQAILHYTDKALQCLNQLSVNADTLRTMALKLLNRQK